MPQSRTSFSLLLLQSFAALAIQSATVTGRVQVQSSSPHAHPSADVVVWLDPAVPLPSPPKPDHVRLLQKNKSFQPHVLVVRTGTIVDFPNEDPIFHNAFSTYQGQLFDVGLYPPGTSRSIRFRRPGIVRVFCNIHPSMAAVILVVDTPYFLKAPPNGGYEFTGVPSGTYRVSVYDERAKDKQQPGVSITVAGDQQEVTVAAIQLSEGNLPDAPHKNKFGLDYPPGSENSGYDGVMK